MLHRLVSLALLAALPLAAARAETTYATLAGNLGATGQANGSIQFFPLGGTTFAQRFTTGTLPAIGDGDSSGQILYRFGWDLLPAQAFDPINENFSNLDTTYAVNLFTDAAGAPGSSLLALGPATGTLSAPGVVEFSYADLVADPSIALQSNTSYWLTVVFQSASEPGVGTALLLPFTTGSNQTGPGTVDNLMVNTGSGWGGIAERAIVQVQAEVVPEPSAIVLTAAGLAILAWHGIRRPAKPRSAGCRAVA
jgi:hypothetical protein